MDWLIYLLKVTICMTLFYAVYHFLLQKLTFFSTNRAYLLSTLLLSFMIPALSFHVRSDQVDPAIAQTPKRQVLVSGLKNISEITTPAAVGEEQTTVTPRFEWQNLLNLAYWIGATVIMLLFAFQFATLMWHTRKVAEKLGSLKIVHTTGRYTNCSFLNYVFVNEQGLDQETLAAVIHHENIHAIKYHSADKLLLALCKALLWFSPPIYFYARALEQVHEYDADRATSRQIGDTAYANLLLSLAVSTSPAPLVNSFVQNPVKARIIMLFTNQSKNMKKLTYLSLIPAGLALVWSFSIKVVYAQSKPMQLAKVLTVRGTIADPSLGVSAPLVSTNLPGTGKPILPSAEENAEAPIRLVDYHILGDDPLVIIDGKKYTAEILTRISPSCIKESRFSIGKAEIYTKNNQVKYATKAEIATAKIRKQMRGNGKFYSRYPVTINGHKHDEVMIKIDGAATEASFPLGYRVMLLIDGRAYTESEARALPISASLNITGLNYRYAYDDAEVKSLYGDRCDVLIEVTKRVTTGPDDVEVTRNASSVLGEDALGRLYFSAKDSVVTNRYTGAITLYGEAKLENSKFNMAADKMVFDKSSRTVLAENVEFKLKGVDTKASLARFDLYKGTYEILTPAALVEKQ